MKIEIEGGVGGREGSRIQDRDPKFLAKLLRTSLRKDAATGASGAEAGGTEAGGTEAPGPGTEAVGSEAVTPTEGSKTNLYCPKSMLPSTYPILHMTQIMELLIVGREQEGEER